MSSQSPVLLINLCTGRRGKGEVERVQNPFSFFFWIEMRSRYVAMVAKFLEVNKPKTSLKKSIRTASNFIDLIQFHLIWQMLAKFSRVACVAGAKSPIPFDACYTGYSRVESERTVSKFRRGKRQLLCCVHRLHKARMWSFMLQGCNNGKETCKIAWCTWKFVVLSIKTFHFFCSSSVAIVVGFAIIQK